jgi:hypothetical protein
MVEYALLVAGNSLGSFSTAATAFMSNLDWQKLSYIALALVALRIAVWAFRVRT